MSKRKITKLNYIRTHGNPNYMSESETPTPTQAQQRRRDRKENEVRMAF